MIRLGKGFYHSYSGGVLPEHTCKPVHFFLEQHIERYAGARCFPDNEVYERERSKHDERKKRVESDRHYHTAYHQYRSPDAQPQHHTYHLIDVVGIRRKS